MVQIAFVKECSELRSTMLVHEFIEDRNLDKH